MKELVRTIRIVEDIYGWGYTFKDIVSQTRMFDGQKIVVPVNSYGGDVTEGMAMYNYLKGLNLEVEARIIGYAMSMGTVICCAADKVIMPENSWYMIHNPTMGKYGDKDDLESGTELLKKMTNDLASIYQKKTGLELDVILDMMKKETWLTGKEALEMGFVDELSEGVSLAAASYDKDFFNKLSNVPASVKVLALSNNENQNQMEKLFAKLTAFFGREINANTTPEELDQAINAFNQAQTDRIQALETSFNTLKDTINSGFKSTITSTLGEVVNSAVSAQIANAKTEITDAVKAGFKSDLDKVDALAKDVNALKSGSSAGRNSNHSNFSGHGDPEGDEKIVLDKTNPLSTLANMNFEIV